MSLIRSFSTINKSSPVLSEVVKQFSKFASHDEILEYSQRPISYCYANRMIDACSPHHSSPVSLIDTASALREQLLVRVAHCICQFQFLPFLPAANPTLLAVHERYLKLFKNLARFPTIETNEDEEKFFELINQFTSRNSDVIGQLSNGCREAQKYFKTYEIMKEFLDQVLTKRLGMRLLAEHYLELHRQQKTKTSSDDHWRGAIAMKFSPIKTIQQCINDVSSICYDTYSVVPKVQIEDHMQQTLPYLPNIVEYILRELLKNSMRAIVEYHKMSLGSVQKVKEHFEQTHEEPLCKILITSDPGDEHFTIAIQDHGGGIDESSETLFRYMYSGNVPKEDEETDVLADFQDTIIRS